MRTPRMDLLKLSALAASAVFASLLLLPGCGSAVQHALFHPTHHRDAKGLTPWLLNGEPIGFARLVADPENIWLLLHGNAGQAADRVYALPSFPPRDAVYILEYPGFGQRSGAPSMETINAAAIAAYEELRRLHPGRRVGIAGESIGSGPSCVLATRPVPPDKIVLLVPFDDLTAVAREHMPHLPVATLLGKTWHNGEALSKYRGPIDIFAAENDRVIPKHHAESLARQVPHARYTVLHGGHNDWSLNAAARFRFE